MASGGGSPLAWLLLAAAGLAAAPLVPEVPAVFCGLASSSVALGQQAPTRRHLRAVAADLVAATPGRPSTPPDSAGVVASGDGVAGGLVEAGLRCLVGLCLVALVFGRPLAAIAQTGTSTRLTAVAPCLLSQCQLPLAKCVLDPACAANLTCIIGCTGSADEKACQIKCGDNFENPVVDEFNACALSSKRCVPQRQDAGPAPGEEKWTPVKGRYPPPPPESVSSDFDVTKMTGRWYITAGLNPLFDTFNCQVHFFEGTAPKDGQPGRLLGKINWRIIEPDGEYLTRSTVQKFVQTKPGLLENHGNEYLHYEDDWYILDHADEDDPENGFVLIYYCGRNDAWAGYGGGTLYTRAKTLPRSILERVAEACERAHVPFLKYWKTTDNTCPPAEDPIKLRAQYAEKLVEQAELTVEEQLTYLGRSAFSEVNKDERYVIDGARRIEKMTEDFVKKEMKVIASEINQVEQEIEKEEENLILRPLQQFFRGIFGRR